MEPASERLSRIYDRTCGYCHLCGKKLSYQNYGRFGEKVAWEIEDSISRSAGGSDHLNNLYAACVACNRSKGIIASRTARKWNDLRRSPHSRNSKERLRTENTFCGAALGGILGLLSGPPGVVLGVVIGAAMGSQAKIRWRRAHWHF
jgi:hypothetical protein